MITKFTDDSGILQLEEKVIPFYFKRHGVKIQIWIQGRVYDVEISGSPGKKSVPAALGERSFEVTAPMPGKILKMNVQAGNHAQTNQSLLVLESMKMEMTVSAPFAGKVEAVLCKIGDLVEMGQLLVKLEAHHE